MKRQKLRIGLKTKSPLLLSDKPIGEQNSVYHSKNYITGSSLRGAFIDLWRRTNNLTAEEVTLAVEQYFQSDGFIFENAYVENGTPLPGTAQTCKQFPGFHYDEDAHGVKDVLLTQYANSENFNPDSLLCNEDNCQSMLKPFEGFVSDKYGNDGTEVKSFRLKSVGFMEAGHVAIDPITKTNIKSRLYFESAIEIGSKFEGILHVPQYLVKEIKLLKGSTLRLGSKRTAGYGEVEIVEIEEWKMKIASDSFVELTTKSINERFELFQNASRKLNLNRKLFSITLMSDMILKDQFFRFHDQLTPELLSELTGLSFEGCKLAHKVIETKRISGWNHMWQTETEECLVIKSGSTFLYEISERNLDNLIEAFQLLENEGIGEKKHEGFGQVVVCHPFHQRVGVV